MRYILIVVIGLGALVLSQTASAQSTTYPSYSPTKSTSRSPYEQKQEGSRRSTAKKKKKGKGKKKNAIFQSMDEAREEFWDRQEKIAKERRKRAKKMEKPQYSDPSYFGHKRKPKIRPLHKRKLCKECGIVH